MRMQFNYELTAMLLAVAIVTGCSRDRERIEWTEAALRSGAIVEGSDWGQFGFHGKTPSVRVFDFEGHTFAVRVYAIDQRCLVTYWRDSSVFAAQSIRDEPPPVVTWYFCNRALLDQYLRGEGQ